MIFAGLLIIASGIFLMTIVGIPEVSRQIRGLEVTSPNYKYWAFGAIALGLFGSVLGHGSLNVALPSIAGDFNTKLPSVQWVVIAYVLTIAALLLPMGRLADLVGRKKVYIAGSLVFVLGAVLASRSNSLLMLILFRILQGVGGAMTEGVGMAIIASVFPANERGKAVGLFMGVVGLGALAGPAIGGLLVDALSWRYVFFVNVPFVLLGIAIAMTVLEESRPTRGPQDRTTSFDWLGAGLSTGALIVLLLVMTNGHKSGWASPNIMLAMLSFLALFGAFMWWELRIQNPMLDLRLFGRKTFSFGVSAAFLSFLGGSAVLVMTPFYMQGVLGFSPWTAGLIMMCAALSMVLLGPISGALSDRYGWRWFTVGGLASSATGLFLLSRSTDQSSLALVWPALIFFQAGVGIFYSPNVSSVLSSVEPDRYGTVSGLLNMVRNGGNIVSLAMATAIITGTMGSLGFEPSLDAVRGTTEAGVGQAFTVGLRNAYLVMMGLLLIGMSVSAVNADRIAEVGPAAPACD
jgi:EmrB/QacA subfamily drug resistance transporter